MADRKRSTLTIRLTQETRDRLEAAQSKLPYDISITSIIERGIELAAQEIDRISSAAGDGNG